MALREEIENSTPSPTRTVHLASLSHPRVCSEGSVNGEFNIYQNSSIIRQQFYKHFSRSPRHAVHLLLFHVHSARVPSTQVATRASLLKLNDNCKRIEYAHKYEYMFSSRTQAPAPTRRGHCCRTGHPRVSHATAAAAATCVSRDTPPARV